MFKSKRLILILSCMLILSGCAGFKSMFNKKDANLAQATQQLSSDNVQVLFQQAKYYQERNEYAEAIQAYENVIKLQADHFEAFNGLGVVYSTLGEHELGIELINEAIRLAPLESHLQNNLGYAYLNQGKLIEAAGAFERALQLDPNNSFAKNNLNSVYQQMGCIQNQPCGQWQEPNYIK